MSVPVHFAPAATDDVRAACRWLDQMRHGLGDQLLIELHRLSDSIGEHPDMCEQVYRGCRRAVLRKFD